ncbi:MAG: hypothetical protein WBE41_26630, partial [Terracidiphilus sp.]
IESRSIDVKKKTTGEWKKGQQFFPTLRVVPFRFAHLVHLSTLRFQFFLDTATRSFTDSTRASSSHRFTTSFAFRRRSLMSICAEAA